jgi:hypothetical protein
VKNINIVIANIITEKADRNLAAFFFILAESILITLCLPDRMLGKLDLAKPGLYFYRTLTYHRS